MCLSLGFTFGVTTTPAQLDRPESRLVASASVSSMRPERADSPSRLSMAAVCVSASGPSSSSASTKKRRPCCVGSRPAEVCGEKISPASSRSAMTLRTDAGDRFTGRMREMVRDPTGSPVSM